LQCCQGSFDKGVIHDWDMEGF